MSYSPQYNQANSTCPATKSYAGGSRYGATEEAPEAGAAAAAAAAAGGAGGRRPRPVRPRTNCAQVMALASAVGLIALVGVSMVFLHESDIRAAATGLSRPGGAVVPSAPLGLSGVARESVRFFKMRHANGSETVQAMAMPGVAKRGVTETMYGRLRLATTGKQAVEMEDMEHMYAAAGGSPDVEEVGKQELAGTAKVLEGNALASELQATVDMFDQPGASAAAVGDVKKQQLSGMSKEQMQSKEVGDELQATVDMLDAKGLPASGKQAEPAAEPAAEEEAGAEPAAEPAEADAAEPAEADTAATVGPSGTFPNGTAGPPSNGTNEGPLPAAKWAWDNRTAGPAVNGTAPADAPAICEIAMPPDTVMCADETGTEGCCAAGACTVGVACMGPAANAGSSPPPNATTTAPPPDVLQLVAAAAALETPSSEKQAAENIPAGQGGSALQAALDKLVPATEDAAALDVKTQELAGTAKVLAGSEMQATVDMLEEKGLPRGQGAVDEELTTPIDETGKALEVSEVAADDGPVSLAATVKRYGGANASAFATVFANATVAAAAAAVETEKGFLESLVISTSAEVPAAAAAEEIPVQTLTSGDDPRGRLTGARRLSASELAAYGFEAQEFYLAPVGWASKTSVDPDWCMAMGGTSGGRDAFHVPRICCDARCGKCGSGECRADPQGAASCCAGAIITSGVECSDLVGPPCHKVEHADTFWERVHNASLAGLPASAVAAGMEADTEPKEEFGHHTVESELAFFTEDSVLNRGPDAAWGSSVADVAMMEIEKDLLKDGAADAPVEEEKRPDEDTEASSLSASAMDGIRRRQQRRLLDLEADFTGGAVGLEDAVESYLRASRWGS